MTPVLMSKGTIFLSALNNSDIVWKIEKSQMMGSLGCRSLGYFHISRNSLQRVMLDKANFRTDKDVTSTVFESKDEPTQMTKQSFTIIYFITYKKTIHFKLICKNVHS